MEYPALCNLMLLADWWRKNEKRYLQRKKIRPSIPAIILSILAEACGKGGLAGDGYIFGLVVAVLFLPGSNGSCLPSSAG